MKQFNKLLMGLVALFLVSGLHAQERYLDEIFTDVNVQSNVAYGANITVITGAPGLDTLLMDVYTPAGDDETDRPVVIYFHTGSFLPAIINGQVTGTKEDSTAAEICRRLARQGYVAISASYRAGWNPVASGAAGQDIRTGTLLNAAYRGIQDARTAIRFLRMTEAEMGDPFGIDPDKITLWGQGTGGYISYGAAFLESYDEIVLNKFIGANAQVYVDSSLSAGPYGLETRPLNIAHHVGYSSDFNLAVNVGGALGDTSWIEGTPEEPSVIGFHVFLDPFAPYLDGPVIVPTTGDFVVNVSGTRRVTEIVNRNGNNTVFQTANEDLNEPINLRNKAYAQADVVTIQGDSIKLSVDNMYPFVTDTLASGPWEWWSLADLQAYVAGVNFVTGEDYDAIEIDATNKLLNPDMSKAKAMAHIDTMMAYFNPRAYLALNLATNTKEILTAQTVEMTVGPNPVSTSTFIQTAADKPMKNLALYHLNGKLMRGIMRVNSSTYELQRGDLPPGIYILQAEFDEGIVTKKLVFN
jgi:hypothetical protein